MLRKSQPVLECEQLYYAVPDPFASAVGKQHSIPGDHLDLEIAADVKSNGTIPEEEPSSTGQSIYKD